MSPDAPAPGFGPDSGTDSAGLMRRIDTTKAHPARVYDVFLGGTDNFPADREAAPWRWRPIHGGISTSGTTGTSYGGP